MKYRVIWMSFILFGIVSAACLAQSSGSFADLFRTGESHQEAHRYADARAAYEEALAINGLTPDQKNIAQVRLAEVLIGLRQFAEARSVMKIMMRNTSLPPAQRLATQKSIATTFMLEGKHAEARAKWIRAQSMKGLSEADKADIQLQIALSYYEAQDYKRAKRELEKVLTMPGADTTQKRSDGWLNYVPSHEAKLRLLKMRPANKKNKTITALFIGSSMTLREYMPYLVEELSKSAPAGRPRIMSAMYTHGGIDIDTFWKEGDARDTARGKLRSVPWDIVVLETFHSMKPEDLLKYGKLFADLARSRKTEPVFYECHPTQSAPYPKESREFHERTVNLGKALNAPVAPVALAELYYVEANPSANREVFYADGIHPSKEGVYMEAYCIYSTITGYSPVGLSLPNSMSEEEGRAMQEAAWKAVRETNPNLKPLN